MKHGKIEGRTLGVIVGDKPMTRCEFVSHLEGKNGFKLIAPNTLCFKDERDLIIVAMRDGVVIIIDDGPYVKASWQMRPIREGGDNYFWDSVLQDVLGCF